MQKLELRNTYTPLDASQVQCNCDPGLNKEETLSVLDLKTGSNNSDVNLHQHRGEQTLSVKVYVLSINGKILILMF